MLSSSQLVASGAGMLLSLASCSYDWAAYEPRPGSQAGGAGGGLVGGGGGSGGGIVGGGGPGAMGGSGGGGSGGLGWFDAGWPYRKSITIGQGNVADTLTDFPLLVRIADDADLMAQAQGPDELVFTAADGVTKLPHEVELFDSAGDLDAWVLVPSLSSATDTQLYLYYGNAAASGQQEPQDVWDNGFVGVWHLAEQSGIRHDSTNRSNDVAEGPMSIGIADNAIAGERTADFEHGQSGYLAIDDADQSGLDLTGSFTASAWINSESNPPTNTWWNFLAKWQGATDDANGGNAYYFALHRISNSDTVLRFAMQSGSEVDKVAGTTSIAANSWHHVTAVYDGSNMQLYVDGASDVIASVNSTGVQNTTTAFSIGNKAPAPNYGYDGLMDEARVSNVARSDGWIATCYVNQRAPEIFVSLGTQQTR